MAWNESKKKHFFLIKNNMINLAIFIIIPIIVYGYGYITGTPIEGTFTITLSVDINKFLNALFGDIGYYFFNLDNYHHSDEVEELAMFRKEMNFLLPLIHNDEILPDIPPELYPKIKYTHVDDYNWQGRLDLTETENCQYLIFDDIQNDEIRVTIRGEKPGQVAYSRAYFLKRDDHGFFVRINK